MGPEKELHRDYSPYQYIRPIELHNYEPTMDSYPKLETLKGGVQRSMLLGYV